ncbi:Hydrolase [Acidisarcina polymorpha]|uniref:Hydrolase n=1 Tax=Acidisarcina polymorpha TaxID=2211140 RepID=A0A2Z5G687_9BACT|nr:alpha/beta hydrolase [Acidisarcina polymorpha]AXC14066.1 Hydrolase [Acidisarcina polymorpha]
MELETQARKSGPGVDTLDRRTFMYTTLATGIALMSGLESYAQTKHAEQTPTVPQIATHYIHADGVEVFYREAGLKDSPVLLLLHGFPASSFQYRELMPLLADKYRVIAPDLPGFGFTNVPSTRGYRYTFENLAVTIEAFTRALSLDRFALYVFDYGAPTGFRLALKHPERITAIISQNGNAYEEGLGNAWDPIQRHWRDPNTENRNALRGALTLEGLKEQYVTTPHPELVKPEGYTLDAALMSRPGNADIQLDLFLDYKSNVKLYPEFQRYFREKLPKTLAVWGRFDPFFLPAGAKAFARDNPHAEVHLIDAGHFALETNVVEVATYVRDFLAA